VRTRAWEWVSARSRRRGSIRTFALVSHFFEARRAVQRCSHSAVKQRNTAVGENAMPTPWGSADFGPWRCCVADPVARATEPAPRLARLPKSTRARAWEWVSVSLTLGVCQRLDKRALDPVDTDDGGFARPKVQRPLLTLKHPVAACQQFQLQGGFARREFLA